MSSPKKISVLILTHNEEKHIERCLDSLLSVVEEIFIVDSFSTDGTVEIAKKMGAKIVQNKWINYAKQFQFGLDNCPIKTKWIMRMDADEFLLPELQKEINSKLDNLEEEVNGIYIKRRMYFNGKWIRYGGKYPEWLLRIWRTNHGVIEERWMDEHVVLKEGKTIKFENDLVDENLNDLTWWTDKHNKYSNREMIDTILTKHKLISEKQVESTIFGNQEEVKRFFKGLYLRVPLFVRPFMYFIWRYFFRLGFLDGKQGLIWHFLQGFWYRFLVDAKIFELNNVSKRSGISLEKLLKEKHEIEIKK